MARAIGNRSPGRAANGRRPFRGFVSPMAPIAVMALTALLSLAVPTAARCDIYSFVDDAGNLHLTDNPRHEGYRLVSRRSPPPRRQAVTLERNRRVWDGVISLAGRRQGVSPALLKAVIHVESAFDPRAVSRKGARGLMQLMPPTAASLGVEDAFDPWQNIAGGARHLRRLIQRYDGDLRLALAAYNAGERAVTRAGGIPPYRETRRYVDRVIKLYREYDGDFR